MYIINSIFAHICSFYIQHFSGLLQPSLYRSLSICFISDGSRRCTLPM